MIQQTESQSNYQSARKSMYLILARMHDVGMNPDIKQVQTAEPMSVNTFMLGQAFISNEPDLMAKNPLENVPAIEGCYRRVLTRVPLAEEMTDFMTRQSQLAFLLFLCGGTKVWFERNTL